MVVYLLGSRSARGPPRTAGLKVLKLSGRSQAKGSGLHFDKVPKLRPAVKERNKERPLAEWLGESLDDGLSWQPFARGEKNKKEAKSFIDLFKSLDPGYEPDRLPAPIVPERIPPLIEPPHEPEPEPKPVVKDVEHVPASVEVRMRLSSKHLILASPYFKECFKALGRKARSVL